MSAFKTGGTFNSLINCMMNILRGAGLSRGGPRYSKDEIKARKTDTMVEAKKLMGIAFADKIQIYNILATLYCERNKMVANALQSITTGVGFFLFSIIISYTPLMIEQTL